MSSTKPLRHTQVAEKTSKFKINSEGSTQGRSALICGLSGLGSSNAISGSGGGLAHIGSGGLAGQPHNNKCSRKESRRKRPSMISEMYTTSFGGGKARGSYGNIHAHHVHSGRCQQFGANRAQSLDHQYNSRRMSDGVALSAGGVSGVCVAGSGVDSSGATRGSDENAICFTHRQHHSLDNEVIGGDKYVSSDSCSVVMMMTPAAAPSGGGVGGANRVQPLGSTCCQLKTAGGGNGAMSGKPGFVASASASAAATSAKSGGKNGTSRTFMSTLRQLKESFHISFERDIKKRMSAGAAGASGSAAAVSKNNNPDYIKTADGYCCAAGAQVAAAQAATEATTDGSPLAGGHEVAVSATGAVSGQQVGRNRACSLDVPMRMWYGSNGNGNAVGADASSRKSSSTTHEDNSNHSNRTLSDPLQIRAVCGGGGSLDGDGNRSDGTTSI